MLYFNKYLHAGFKNEYKLNNIYEWPKFWTPKELQPPSQTIYN